MQLQYTSRKLKKNYGEMNHSTRNIINYATRANEDKIKVQYLLFMIFK